MKTHTNISSQRPNETDLGYQRRIADTVSSLKEATSESTLPRCEATPRRIKLGKYGLSENVIGKHVSLDWQGRKLLGEVTDAQYNATRGYVELTVRHFNGEDWPLRPVASAVAIIDPLSVSQSATNYSKP